MKITIESTGIFTEVAGMPCRIWRGVTEQGVGCDLAIALIRVGDGANLAQMEAELKTMPPPLMLVSMRDVF
jgi:hypothetical protein